MQVQIYTLPLIPDAAQTEEMNVFVQPDEQSRACSSYAMARKRSVWT